MFDRVKLIRALNPTLGLMFDWFCQACPRLAIYRKVRKNSLSAQFSVERYIVFIITKPSSSPSRPHHQAIPTTKPSSSPSRLRHQAVPTTKPSPPRSRPHQAVPTKPSPPSRPHQAVPTKPSSPSRSHQAVFIIKQCSSLSNDRSKSTYQVNLPSHLIKPPYQAVASTQKRP
jgi:hypothetical protein